MAGFEVTTEDKCVLHLSEHHGDSSPGSALRIETDDIDAMNRELKEKSYKFAKPAIEDTQLETREMRITDPFGNRLVFVERIG